MDISEIWIEKYRPKMLSEIAGQKFIIERLSAFVKSKNLPHCLFSGPAGCGKTTAALCIANELYGNAVKANFLELNASDERGIDTIRIKVKDFARTIPLDKSFKIIYLDEADSLTKDAQHALRRTMERYSDTARFILSCNYSSKIIIPIQSRTAVFRFTQLKESEVIVFLKGIAKNENLTVDDDAFKSIFYLSEGDMRKAINILQMAAITEKAITADVVYNVMSTAEPMAVKDMLLFAVNGNFRSAREKLLDMMLANGLSGEDIIKEMHNQIFTLQTDDIKKLQMLERIGEYEHRISSGSNTRIQLEALLAQIALIGVKKE